MTKEQKLKVLEKAIDQGATISINFSDDSISREEVEQRVKNFASLFNKPYYH